MACSAGLVPPNRALIMLATLPTLVEAVSHLAVVATPQAAGVTVMGVLVSMGWYLATTTVGVSVVATVPRLISKVGDVVEDLIETSYWYLSLLVQVAWGVLISWIVVGAALLGKWCYPEAFRSLDGALSIMERVWKSVWGWTGSGPVQGQEAPKDAFVRRVGDFDGHVVPHRQSIEARGD